VTRRALYEWVPAAGWPYAPSLERAQAEFAAAMTAYDRGDPAVAAQRFQAAARLVPESDDPRYADALAAMRDVARRNAELAQTPIGR
jgi:hypothetical protein